MANGPEERDLERLEAELEEMDTEFRALDADLVGLGAEAELGIAELDEELEEAGLEEFGLEEAEAISLEGLVEEGEEGRVDAEFLHRWLKRKARRLIRWLIRLARRYRHCRQCIVLLTRAIVAYRRNRYVSALRYAYRTYRCLRRCARRR